MLTEDRGAVRILTMNWPDRMNALNTALTQALLDALEAADQADTVRAIVLAGAGRSFCAGADLSEFKDLTPDRQHLVAQRADLTCRTHSVLQKLRKPVLSGVQGAAVGGGAGLAIGCDMMVAGADLKFGYSELKHFIVPALVMTGLQRQLGRKLAFELISMGRILGADEVLSLGLASRVAATGQVLEATMDIATSWVGAHPLAMAAAKSLFYRVANLPFDAAMAAGRDVNALMRSFRDVPK